MRAVGNIVFIFVYGCAAAIVFFSVLPSLFEMFSSMSIPSDGQLLGVFLGASVVAWGINNINQLFKGE